MKLGILIPGHPPPALADIVRSYADFVRDALGPTHTYDYFDVVSGTFPGTETNADAYIITGSAASVNDQNAWIGPLQDWLCELDPTTPLIGLCFGHQVIAKAYGGMVERCGLGFVSGLEEYEISSRAWWMDEAASVVLPAFNQDRVVTPPANARSFLASDESPYAALTYTNRRVLSFQSHPEYPIPFVARAIQWCRADGRIDQIQASRALASLHKRNDCSRVLGWIQRFLVSHEDDSGSDRLVPNAT